MLLGFIIWNDLLKLSFWTNFMRHILRFVILHYFLIGMSILSFCLMRMHALFIALFGRRMVLRIFAMSCGLS